MKENRQTSRDERQAPGPTDAALKMGKVGTEVAMEIFTPHGLKVRLCADRVNHVLAPVREVLDYEEVLLDIELWANLPSAISSVVTIATAAITKSPFLTIGASCLGFLLADLYQQFAYSNLLKILIPQLLGSWPISLIISLLTGFYLVRIGALATAIIEIVIVCINIFKGTDFLLIVFMPVRVFVRKLFGKTARSLGGMELAFVKILNYKAERLGVVLDWTLYNRHEK